MIDESTIENRGVLEANDVVDVIKVQPTKKTKETLNKSISYYEKLLDDLKIGKKCLFEKVDNAINEFIIKDSPPNFKFL